MIKQLASIANELDNRGLCKEADAVDNILKSAAVIRYAPDEYSDMSESEWLGDYYDEYYDFTPSPDFEFSNGPFELTFNVHSNPDSHEIGDLKSVRVGNREIGYHEVIDLGKSLPNFDTEAAQKVVDFMKIEFFNVNDGELHYGLPATIEASTNEVVLEALRSDLRLGGLMNFKSKSWHLNDKELKDLSQAVLAAQKAYDEPASPVDSGEGESNLEHQAVSATRPEPGTLAHTARMMAGSNPSEEEGEFWDRWKDEMKDRRMSGEDL